MTQWITKCVRDYKVCQGRLQSVTGITKCDAITKYGGTHYSNCDNRHCDNRYCESLILRKSSKESTDTSSYLSV